MSHSGSPLVTWCRGLMRCIAIELSLTTHQDGNVYIVTFLGSHVQGITCVVQILFAGSTSSIRARYAPFLLHPVLSQSRSCALALQMASYS